MSKTEVFSFIRENPVCSIATIDGDQPRVRAFLAVLFDDDAIYFTTGAVKNVYRQICANPNVELCFLTPDFSRMLRVTGRIDSVDDREKKQHLIDERDYLKGHSADDPRFILLRLSHGTAKFWTLADNMKENETEKITF